MEPPPPVRASAVSVASSDATAPVPATAILSRLLPEDAVQPLPELDSLVSAIRQPSALPPSSAALRVLRSVKPL